jgi:hypothetical protein
VHQAQDRLVDVMFRKFFSDGCNPAAPPGLRRIVASHYRPSTSHQIF